MAHVLTMTASEICDPVAHLVDMKAGDRALHGVTTPAVGSNRSAPPLALERIELAARGPIPAQSRPGCRRMGSAWRAAPGPRALCGIQDRNPSEKIIAMPMTTTAVPAICNPPSDSFNAKDENSIVSTTVPVTITGTATLAATGPVPADAAKQVEVSNLREPDAQACCRRPCVRSRGELQHVTAAGEQQQRERTGRGEGSELQTDRREHRRRSGFRNVVARHLHEQVVSGVEHRDRNQQEDTGPHIEVSLAMSVAARRHGRLAGHGQPGPFPVCAP